jgi:hypothetical protein
LDSNHSTGLRFYQKLSVPLENLYDSALQSGCRDIQAGLEAQFKSNLMLLGFESWNVPLHRSLNSMPPRCHRNGLLGDGSPSEITTVRAFPATDLVLTASAGDAGVNIWSARAGLTRIHAFNFKQQAENDPGSSLSRARLHFLEFELEDCGAGVQIYRPRGQGRPAAAPGQQSQHGEPVQDEDREEDKDDGAFMQALFAEDATEAAAALGHLADGDSSSSSGCDESEAAGDGAKEEGAGTAEDLPDIFAALELGEQLAKESAAKEAESKAKALTAKKVESATSQKAAQPLPSVASKSQETTDAGPTAAEPS